MFHHLRNLMTPGGKLFIVDASSGNLFDVLGLKNPFNPDIEWFKHQRPESWALLLSECGFSNPRISWLSEAWLTHVGIGTVPKAMSYFLSSAFRLEMDCAERQPRARS
jgi:hypothetical protein